MEKKNKPEPVKDQIDNQIRLQNLCKSRGWSQPRYVVTESTMGYSFTITVNGQEFTGAVSPFTYQARESVAEMAHNTFKDT